MQISELLPLPFIKYISIVSETVYSESIRTLLFLQLQGPEFSRLASDDLRLRRVWLSGSFSLLAGFFSGAPPALLTLRIGTSRSISVWFCSHSIINTSYIGSAQDLTL